MNRVTGFAGAGMFAVMLGSAPTAWAEQYTIDPSHSFVEFSISHLGISVLRGRFNDMKGSFNYDQAKPAASSVEATVATASLDTNHAERDKHVRSKDFLDVEKFPQASFVTTGYSVQGNVATLKGKLTLHGVTRPISVAVQTVGAGNDPWGGYRRGFIGRTQIRRSDFGISYNLGPAAEVMDMAFFIEGIRK